MGDLQRDIRPGNACSGLLLLAYTHRNRLELPKGLELASKYEFDSPLFLDFSKLLFLVHVPLFPPFLVCTHSICIVE